MENCTPSTEPGCGGNPPIGGFIQITQSILTHDRDSGCNSHNRCVFDQKNCELCYMYFLYRCFNLYASFALTAGIRTRRWTGGSPIEKLVKPHQALAERRAVSHEFIGEFGGFLGAA